LSSCKPFDYIIVFSKGSVIRHWSNDAPVAGAEGKYHELWQARTMTMPGPAALWCKNGVKTKFRTLYTFKTPIKINNIPPLVI